MNPFTAVDFCTRHKVVADQIAASCDLGELALELLRLFAHAARQLHTELGWLAMTLELHEMANATDERWAVRHAAELILADQMTADPALRDFGSGVMAQRWHVINATADVVDVIAAIPSIWFRLLPALDTSLLEHFASELDEGCP